MRARAHHFAASRIPPEIPSPEGIRKVCHGLSQNVATQSNEKDRSERSRVAMQSRSDRPKRTIQIRAHAGQSTSIGQLHSVIRTHNVRNAVTSTNTPPESAS